jgi:hypothetical protein
MPVTLASQEAEIRRISVRSQSRQSLRYPISKKIHHKKGPVEWLKVLALSLNPNTEKKKKEIPM